MPSFHDHSGVFWIREIFFREPQVPHSDGGSVEVLVASLAEGLAPEQFSFYGWWFIVPIEHFIAQGHVIVELITVYYLDQLAVG